MYIDTHCHLSLEDYDDIDLVVKENREAGIDKIIISGYSRDTIKESLEIIDKYSDVYATIGYHPSEADITTDEDISLLEKQIQNKKVVGIGEIGLDYHYDTDKEIQKQAFIKQIELANKYNLPITIHTREAVMDTIQILKEHPVKQKGVFHCCPFNRELVKEALKLGFYISFAGVCTFKNSNAEEIAKMVPNDKFTIETDSPYLSPVPNRGKRNDSRNLQYIVDKLSEFKGLSKEEIARLSYNNTINLYKIDI